MKINEVSKKYQLSVDTLRYYEKEGLIPPVPRNASGLREYDEESCRSIEFVKCMRGAGMPIEILARYVALCRLGDGTIPERIAILRSVREEQCKKMEALQRGLDRLDYKLDLYNRRLKETNNESIPPLCNKPNETVSS